MTKQVATILDVPFTTRGFRETVDHITERIQSGQKTHVVTANPEIVMVARENRAFRSIVEQAYVVPDGIGIVYAAKWTNQPIYERVTGVELLEALMAKADQHQWGVYLLGAKPDVIHLAKDKLSARYPNARIVGCRDGYFCPEEETQIVQEIAEAKPQLLFVALGAPRQDEWMAKYRDQLNASLMMGVGGSFDVISGKVKRAPEIWQKLHLEWFYRLASEPSRWKRQLAIPRFVLTVLKEKWSSRS
ncbi:WecB/TagA/CpsF family glycosyltransferase [Brevibacillus formosus]|uniref:N-acetylglucosaminyldiphosphoundecaprenol N-acetyl-beta-D-mannosaminyltransferase n=1 Tax=Brevibacillus formosus TaxID=54913 RepID=A0A837KPV2_9BACL|nr:WecB/TagA/CpsF family glycosyltransferase [Brevibacillus formosus]KLH99001.1 N-acetylmannosaminyltransferase [Brevibacillus formosus]MED1956389.1 WecB/TagA/CpsF family glycosyltransferase [Brevibacillus formosus]PSJ98027.1 glycosyltransferase [Brevibacillus formosus]GED56776.1 acetylglucosaminyldiphosphoundecaprenol acetyl-beta-D-mannosaminyltransferase [Brevibacillus formosus]